MAIFKQELDRLEQSGNFRSLPSGDILPGCIDFVSNDYLGLGSDNTLHDEFLSEYDISRLKFTASASRLLAPGQGEFAVFERTLESAYGSPALLFNSGYHANTGLIPALCDSHTVIIADKLVHASIIDGIKLAGVAFERFRHNDTAHLQRLVAKHSACGKRIMIIVESVYSMDGDESPLEDIVRIKHSLSDALLYVDEAHAVGVKGRGGLGIANDLPAEMRSEVDVIVGTMGKALASVGAYAILSKELKDWAVNKARSFIFSTVLPPINVAWSTFIFEKAMKMEERRLHLSRMGRLLGRATGSKCSGHIHPLIVGEAHKALKMAKELAEMGFNILPIRTPTVPPGTERLRISLSAAHSEAQILALADAINTVKNRYDDRTNKTQ